ncbi:MAG TPA: hypothetical protein DDY68_06550 [Porphyromonadaceae bacterium]|nr:hypothetical protein [Porphyromonadaceae bacterium]
MKIEEHIDSTTDSLIKGLVPVLRIMAKIDSSNDADISLNLSSDTFVSPVFILAMIVYKSTCSKKITITGANQNYLKTIGFYSSEIKPDEIRKSEFLALMEGYSHKTYIPIISFPAKTNSDQKDVILSVVEGIIIRQVGIAQNVANGIKYMVEEIIDNITEHSHTDRGFIFAQAYKYKGFVDICIADKGITLLGSYKNANNNDISDDMEALKAANRRISSKNRPEAENRGFGIYTSKKMLIEGLQGEYLMISGNSIYTKNRNFDKFYTLPHKIRWNGTIVAFRIPYQSAEFNYINYLE